MNTVIQTFDLRRDHPHYNALLDAFKADELFWMGSGLVGRVVGVVARALDEHTLITEFEVQLFNPSEIRGRMSVVRTIPLRWQS